MWFEYFPFPCISQNLSCIKTDHRFITIYVKKLSFSVVPLSCADVKKKNLCNTNITLLMKQILKACPQTCGLCSVNDCNDLDSQFCTKNQALCDHQNFKLFMLEYCRRISNACGLFFFIIFFFV